MEQCLVAIYGPEVGHREAEAMMILIADLRPGGRTP